MVAETLPTPELVPMIIALAFPELVGNASLLVIVKDLATTVTLVGAAFVGYLKFLRGHPLAARANIQQSVQSVRLDDRYTVVQVKLVAENTGDVVLEPVEGYTLLQVLRPLSEELAARLNAREDPVGPTGTEIDFPIMHRRPYAWKSEGLRIDPKESTEEYCEFIVPADVQVVNIYSSLTLDKDHPDVAWEINTYDAISADSSRQVIAALPDGVTGPAGISTKSAEPVGRAGR